MVSVAGHLRCERMEELQPERLLSPPDPASPAVIAGDRTLTWDDVERRARCVARALEGAGVDIGEVWGVLARTGRNGPR